MKKVNQLGFDPGPTPFNAARVRLIQIMLFTVIGILAVGGLINNGWAVPGGECIKKQIKSEPFNGRGLPKKAFTIILNDLATGTGL